MTRYPFETDCLSACRCFCLIDWQSFSFSFYLNTLSVQQTSPKFPLYWSIYTHTIEKGTQGEQHRKADMLFFTTPLLFFGNAQTSSAVCFIQSWRWIPPSMSIFLLSAEAFKPAVQPVLERTEQLLPSFQQFGFEIICWRTFFGPLILVFRPNQNPQSLEVPIFKNLKQLSNDWWSAADCLYLLASQKRRNENLGCIRENYFKRENLRRPFLMRLWTSMGTFSNIGDVFGTYLKIMLWR